MTQGISPGSDNEDVPSFPYPSPLTRTDVPYPPPLNRSMSLGRYADLSVDTSSSALVPRKITDSFAVIPPRARMHAVNETVSQLECPRCGQEFDVEDDYSEDD